MLNVLDVAELEGVEGVVYASTSEVYGRYTFDDTEDTPTCIPAPNNPRWGYAAAKLTAEHLAQQHPVPVTTFRIFNTYGPGQLGDGAVHNFVRAAVRGEPLQIRGTGEALRAWCYVEDMVDALVAAINRLPKTWGVFNVGNPTQTATTYQLARMVCRLTETSSRIAYLDEAHEDVEVRVPCVEKARRLLEWEPKTTLLEGLNRTIRYERLGLS